MSMFPVLEIPILREVASLAHAHADHDAALADALTRLANAEEHNENVRIERLRSAPKCVVCGTRFLGERDVITCSVGCTVEDSEWLADLDAGLKPHP